VVFLAVRFFAEAIFFEKNGLTTAEVTNGNIYKSLENFAPLPALDLQGIRNGYVGCRHTAASSAAASGRPGDGATVDAAHNELGFICVWGAHPR